MAAREPALCLASGKCNEDTVGDSLLDAGPGYNIGLEAEHADRQGELLPDLKTSLPPVTGPAAVRAPLWRPRLHRPGRANEAASVGRSVSCTPTSAAKGRRSSRTSRALFGEARLCLGECMERRAERTPTDHGERVGIDEIVEFSALLDPFHMVLEADPPQ